MNARVTARRRTATLLFAGAVVAACAGTPPRAPTPSAARVSAVTSSNVLRADYAGSASCKPCHEAIYAKWQASPMRNMTRSMPDAAIVAPFSGTALRFKDDHVDLARDGNARFVVVSSKTFGDHVYRVTRVIGGHYREDYAGQEVDAKREDARLLGSPDDELILPISYLLGSGTYRYKGYSVMARDRPGLRAGPTWNQTCIFCHNTAPYFSSILPLLDGRKHAAYQGVTVDPLLPPEKRWRVEVSDQGAIDDALDAETTRLIGASGGSSRIDVAISATRDGFHADDLIEVGIGCEACHGGAKEHALDSRVKPSLAPHAKSFALVGIGATDKAMQINRTCARCHQVLFSQYPYTWEGGARGAPVPGGSHINSGEARDFLLGKCSTKAYCTQCHDPHDRSNRERAAQLETRTGDAVCIGCHAKYDGDAAVAAHTHHLVNGAGARCIACHMPKKNMALDLGLTRYHRIGSPTDDDRIRDRPLECVLCHTDKSAVWVADGLARFWGKRVDRSVLDAIYGNADDRVLDSTLARGRPHEQAVALFLLGEAKDKRATKAIANELANPYPLVRFYAAAALTKSFGATPDVDLYAEPDEIKTQTQKWIDRQKF
ncbi:hypothetical protein BH09MYX1_BH09MYX1_08000 [soil metagenome]